jgi:hypothetical protein
LAHNGFEGCEAEWTILTALFKLGGLLLAAFHAHQQTQTINLLPNADLK